jgi:hypothetical protein
VSRALPRVSRVTKLSKWKCESASPRLLHPVPLSLLSQPHSTALPSPKRYDKRYEDRFLSRGEPKPQRFIYYEAKQCMLEFLKLVADFSRGCALSVIRLHFF